MKKYYRLEVVTIVLIFLYQFANKSPQQEFLGVDKMIYFSAFGLYSLLITIYEVYTIKTDLKSGVVLLHQDDRTQFILAAIFFISIAVLLFLNLTVNSSIYVLNILFGAVYLYKSFISAVIASKLAINKDYKKTLNKD